MINNIVPGKHTNDINCTRNPRDLISGTRNHTCARPGVEGSWVKKYL